MTTYDAYKEKQKNAKAAENSKRQKGVKYSVGSVAGSPRTRINDGNSISADKPNTASQSNRAVRVRPDRSHSKAEPISTSMIPKIFGLAQKKKFQTNKAEAVNRYPLALGVAIIALVTLMFMVLVGNAVKISSMKTATTQKNAQLEMFIERKDELKLALEKRDDLRYIEEIAKNQYGMIKKDYVAKHYITLGSEDKIEVVGTAPDSDKFAD